MGTCAQTAADVCSYGVILSNELERLLQLTDLKLCLSILIAGRDEYLIKDGHKINPEDSKQLRAQETYFWTWYQHHLTTHCRQRAYFIVGNTCACNQSYFPILPF